MKKVLILDPEFFEANWLFSVADKSKKIKIIIDCDDEKQMNTIFYILKNDFGRHLEEVE
jgi:hypothetical protein